MKKSKAARIGVVGCGDIARKGYLPFLMTHRESIEVVACSDLRSEMADGLAIDFEIPRVYDDIDALLADRDIDVVLNLTHPAGHAPVNLRALEAGKHTFCEKPFALNRAEGQQVLDAAAKAGLLVGCAPDTVLGSGTQSARHLIESGAIGKPLYARLNWTSAGHEHWHPNPAFYYQSGGGPLLDMGPYYLSALIQCLGPIKSVEGRAVTGFAERVIASQPLAGQTIPVETPTHYIGSLETHSGVIVQVAFSFDMKFGASGNSLPEYYGSEGMLQGTDPNAFNGEPALNRVYPGKAPVSQWPSHHYAGGRGLGLLDLIRAIQEGRNPRASGELAYHVLDAMLAFHDAEKTGARVQLKSTCALPPAMEPGGFGRWQN